MQPTPISCKNCGHQFTGSYCNTCGEKVYTHHDKSVVHLLEEGFHFVSHFEGKFFTTVKTILTSPGKLTADYTDGIRKKYFKPLSFFLLLVVVYLLVPVAQGLNMSLGSHITMSTYGGYARRQVVELMTSKHLTEQYVAEHFHTASEKVSKILLVLIIPVLALWAWLLSYKRKDKVFFDHFIFSTEINSFLLLWGFLLMPVITRLIFSLASLFMKKAYFPDTLVGVTLTGFISVYTFLAAKRFYGLTTPKAVLFTLLFVALYIGVVQYLYKFFLFFITLKLVH